MAGGGTPGVPPKTMGCPTVAAAGAGVPEDEVGVLPNKASKSKSRVVDTICPVAESHSITCVGRFDIAGVGAGGTAAGADVPRPTGAVAIAEPALRRFHGGSASIGCGGGQVAAMARPLESQKATCLPTITFSS